MKVTSLNFAMACAVVAMVSCESFNQPIDTGGYDPLLTPGSSFDQAEEVPTGPQFEPGSFAQTVIPEAAFFNSYPKGEATADRALKMNSVVKVVGTRQSFVRVELEDGAVGFVPSMMLAPQGQDVTAAPDQAPLIIPGGDLDIPPFPNPGNPEDIGAPVLPALNDLPEPATLPEPAVFQGDDGANTEPANPAANSLVEPATGIETPALPNAPAEPEVPSVPLPEPQ